MSQKQLEKEIEEIEEKYYTLKRELEKKKKELENKREYIDTLILGNYNEGELQNMFELSDKQTKSLYDAITDMYVRYNFKTKKLSIVEK